MPSRRSRCERANFKVSPEQAPLTHALPADLYVLFMRAMEMFTPSIRPIF